MPIFHEVTTLFIFNLVIIALLDNGETLSLHSQGSKIDELTD